MSATNRTTTRAARHAPHVAECRDIMTGAVAAAVIAFGALASACGPTVDCENFCRRTIACEVDFAAPDDPNGDRVASGERSELEACVLGCESSPLVTVESATCIDAVDTSDASECQDDVLLCLGVDESGAPL